MNIDRALTTGLTAIGGLLGHHGGDYLAQPDWCAAHKQQRTARGRLALAAHALEYAIVQGLTKTLVYRVAGHQVHPLAQVAGGGAEALAHAVIDDGGLLARFAHKTGKGGFHDLADHGVNGRMLLDQASHHQLQIPIGVAVTVGVEAWLRRRSSR